MLAYALRRIATSLALLALSSLVIFLVLRVIPGDPTITALGGSIKDVDPRALQEARHTLRLDESLPAQYVHWIGGLFQGDFGKSYFSQFSVTELVSQSIGATFQLAVAALVVGLAIAVPLATLAAIWRNRVFSAFVAGFTALGLATPAFITGIILIVVFGKELHWLPTQGYVSMLNHPGESLKAVLLPAITLGIAVAAPILRILQASISDVSSAPFIRTAEGKGLLRRRVVLGHVLPNAALPVLTTIGVTIGALLGGAVVVEYVFARPGLGTLLVDSVFKRDYGVLQALVLLAAAAFIASSVVVDILYGVVDPRLRTQRSAA